MIPPVPTPPANSGPLLTVDGLTTEVLTASGPRRLLHRLDFHISPREWLAVVGESGSGKSMTMLSVLGLLPQPALVTAGSAVFLGQDLLRLPPEALRRIRGAQIGMIFQEPMTALNPVVTVGAQIAEALRVHEGLGRRAAWAEAVQLLNRVRIPGAAERAHLYPHQLSGGMRQRVVIAAAIACKPVLLVADEPTTALDPTVQAGILALLAELRREVGCAVILVTHDMGLVRNVADRIVVMRDGRIVEQGERDAVVGAPREAYTRTLLAASTIPRAAAPRPLSDRAALEVSDVTVSFPVGASTLTARRHDRLFAVDGVSLSMGKGETLALVGESGSGKTTLARAILGLVTTDAGTVRIDGRTLCGSPATGGRAQFVFQDPQASLDPRIRIWESVVEPVELAGARRSSLRAHAAGLLADVGLGSEYLDRLPHELSGGQRQRVGIARALSVDPQVLIADEAVAALDAATRLQVLDLLAALQKRTGIAILFITHDFGVVSRLAHRVAVMRFGRILEIGPTETILSQARHPYTRALLAATRGHPGDGTATSDPRRGGHRSGRAGTHNNVPALRSVGVDHAVELTSHES